jgi:hypothetical protein
MLEYQIYDTYEMYTTLSVLNNLVFKDLELNPKSSH